MRDRVRAVLGSRWFKLLLSAGLLAFLFRRTDLGAMRAALAAARPGWVVLALATIVLSQVMSAYRWTLLARPLAFRQPFSRICLYYFSGMYLNLFGPGTVAGDVGRVLLLGGRDRRALAFTTVLAHRVIGFVALVWIGATAIVVLPDQPLPQPFRWLAALAIPATFAAWLWGPRLAARLLPPAHNWRILIERELAPYWHDRALLVLSLGLAITVQSMQLGAQVFVARALGLHLPFVFFAVVAPLVTIAGTLPFSLQGLGVREAGYWYYLSTIGVPREAALAIGLLTSIVMLASNLSGLPAFLALRGQQPAAAATGAPADRGVRR